MKPPSGGPITGPISAGTVTHDQRVQSDEAPAGLVEAPAVLADHCEIILPLLLGRRLLRHGTDRRRVVADVVIAGQMTAGHGQRIVQLFRKFQVVGAGRRVEREVAAVDDKIGTRRVDVPADPMKIVGELLQAAGEVGIGNLRQAKFGHAAFLSARS